MKKTFDFIPLQIIGARFVIMPVKKIFFYGDKCFNKINFMIHYFILGFSTCNSKTNMDNEGNKINRKLFKHLPNTLFIKHFFFV